MQTDVGTTSQLFLFDLTELGELPERSDRYDQRQVIGEYEMSIYRPQSETCFDKRRGTGQQGKALNPPRSIPSNGAPQKEPNRIALRWPEAVWAGHETFGHTRHVGLQGFLLDLTAIFSGRYC